MLFASDDGFSQLTTYGCIFGTFRYHIWIQRKNSQNTCVCEHFLNEQFFFRSSLKIFLFGSLDKFSKILKKFYISKSQNVIFLDVLLLKRRFDIFKITESAYFRQKAKCVLKMSKFCLNLTFQCPFSVSKFGSNHGFRPVLEMP